MAWQDPGDLHARYREPVFTGIVLCFSALFGADHTLAPSPCSVAKLERFLSHDRNHGLRSR